MLILSPNFDQFVTDIGIRNRAIVSLTIISATDSSEKVL